MARKWALSFPYWGSYITELLIENIFNMILTIPEWIIHSKYWISFIFPCFTCPIKLCFCIHMCSDTYLPDFSPQIHQQCRYTPFGQFHPSPLPPTLGDAWIDTPMADGVTLTLNCNCFLTVFVRDNWGTLEQIYKKHGI